MKRVLLLVLILFVMGSGCTIRGCTIFTSKGEDGRNKVTVKMKPKQKQPNTLFTNSVASEDLSGILQEKPGKYPRDDDRHFGTLPEALEKDLATLPANMTADVAFNQLIYLMARDYHQLQARLTQIDTPVTISGSRKGAPKEKEKLTVNVAIVVDAGKEMAKKLPDTQRTKMDMLKLQLKNAIRNLAEDYKTKWVTQGGINYQITLQTYGAKIGKYTPQPVPLEQAESILFPLIDQIQPGSVGTLAATLGDTKTILSSQTAGDVVNHIYVISAGVDGLQPDPTHRAQEIFESEIQGHVHVMDYGIKRQTTKDRLQLLPDRTLGDYLIVETSVETFDLTDQTDFSEDDYQPREYSILKHRTWPERLTELKTEQIESLDTLYVDEYEQLQIAANQLKMNEQERMFLLEKIESRKRILGDYVKGRVDKMYENVNNTKKRRT
jgi:Ca-activated chloride channel homolog